MGKFTNMTRRIWTSRKLWMTILSVTILWFAYWKEVDYLYTFTEPAQITAFVGITRDFMVALTGVVMAYLGVQGFIQWKHGTESIVNQVASSITEKKEETINQNIKYFNSKEEDYTLEPDEI